MRGDSMIHIAMGMTTTLWFSQRTTQNLKNIFFCKRLSRYY